MTRPVFGLLLVLVLGLVHPARADSVVIGYLELTGDARYQPETSYARLDFGRRDRPLPGAQVALDETRAIARVTHNDFTLETVAAASVPDLIQAMERARTERHIHFFLADAPAVALKALTAATRGQDVLLFNVTEPDDDLRRDDCADQLVHTLPSQAMLSDALAQYLVARKWRDVLLLSGPAPEDAVQAAAFERSAKRFGLNIVERKNFKLSNDPRQRDAADVGLLTATARDYDVVFVADSDGEFARTVPYRTTRARPVVGSIGLVPDAWHWTWERDGGPQLNDRFQTRAGRHMTGPDWAAWMAVKAIVQSVLRSRSTDFATVSHFMLTDGSFDGWKGVALGFRPWDHQLRQPILLTTPVAVVGSAPLPGFLHPTDDLDTLGDDQPETRCQLNKK